MKAILRHPQLVPYSLSVLGGMLLTLIIAVMIPTDYVKAPAESCKATATGRENTQYMTTYICAGFDSKGNCTAQVPVLTPITYREQNMACAWVEWN